jgi:hypothetical protein
MGDIEAAFASTLDPGDKEKGRFQATRILYPNSRNILLINVYLNPGAPKEKNETLDNLAALLGKIVKADKEQIVILAGDHNLRGMADAGISTPNAQAVKFGNVLKQYDLNEPGKQKGERPKATLWRQGKSSQLDYFFTNLPDEHILEYGLEQEMNIYSDHRAISLTIAASRVGVARPTALPKPPTATSLRIDLSKVDDTAKNMYHAHLEKAFAAPRFEGKGETRTRDPSMETRTSSETKEWIERAWERRRLACKAITEAAEATLPAVRPPTGRKPFLTPGAAPQRKKIRKIARILNDLDEVLLEEQEAPAATDASPPQKTYASAWDAPPPETNPTRAQLQRIRARLSVQQTENGVEHASQGTVPADPGHIAVSTEQMLADI